MGLDMYLSKRTYVKNWNFMEPEELHSVTVRKNGKIVKGIKKDRITHVEEEIMYWRKANAIHNWFVNECADGVDECQRIRVDLEDLQKLLNVINDVLSKVKMVEGDILMSTTYHKGKTTKNYEVGKIVGNPAVCDELLPTTSGFFFGGTEYSEYYIEDLKRTKEMIEEELSAPEVGRYGSDYIYQASW